MTVWRTDLGDGYWYDNKPDFYMLKLDQIDRFQKRFKARYVCEWDTLNDPKRSYTSTCIILWSDIAHPEGSNWIGLYNDTDTWYVKDGFNASRIPIQCVVSNSKQVLFSKSRNDFRESTDRSVIVDGGRDYTRVLGNIDCERVWMVPQDGELRIIPETMARLMTE